MIAPERIDETWLAANPLPQPHGAADKNSRGRVLLVGGSMLVPGALRLTGEAVLRGGAGKVRMATVADAALPLGMAVPEAAVMALPTNAKGEIAPKAAALLKDAVDACDTLIFGPGMGERDCAAALLEPLLAAPRDDLTIVLDAAAVSCAGAYRKVLHRHEGRIVFTPHHGEMAALTGREAAQIAEDPAAAALDAAERFGGVVVLKANETFVAAPDGALLHYPGGGVGLATGGSGDVLAGIIGALLARGVALPVAAGWGVWLHGEAGRRLAHRMGTMGFLGRELIPEIPELMSR